MSIGSSNPIRHRWGGGRRHIKYSGYMTMTTVNMRLYDAGDTSVVRTWRIGVLHIVSGIPNAAIKVMLIRSVNS